MVSGLPMGSDAPMNSEIPSEVRMVSGSPMPQGGSGGPPPTTSSY